MATVTTPIATDATLSSGLTAIKNAIADTRGTTSMQCDNSDSWSSSTTYAVGKTVIYDNKVWECLVQNNGQTPSGTSTYWKQVTLSSLNSSLTQKKDLLLTITSLTQATYSVSDFSKYRYIYCELKNTESPARTGTIMIPTIVLPSTNYYSFNAFYGSSTYIVCLLQFTNSTTIKIVGYTTAAWSLKQIDIYGIT